MKRKSFEIQYSYLPGKAPLPSPPPAPSPPPIGSAPLPTSNGELSKTKKKKDVPKVQVDELGYTGLINVSTTVIIEYIIVYNVI